MSNHMVTKLAMLMIVGLALIGCRSPEAKNNSSLAAVEITGYNVAEVREATRAVMRSHDYTEAEIHDFDMVFEKPASRRDTAAFGSLMVDELWERVQMRIRRKPSGSVFLACEVYMVENKGEGMFESERQLAALRNARYQGLLDEVKTRLGRQPVAP